MLKMIIFASGSVFRILLISSNPETSGRLMSIMVTSGLQRTKARWPGFGVAGFFNFHGGVGGKKRPASRDDHGMIVN